MYNQEQPAGTQARGLRDANATIREPGPLSKASETLGSLNEMDSVMRELRIKMYGSYPEANEAQEKRSGPPSLEEMLAMICQRSAMAVGELRNILGRME